MRIFFQPVLIILTVFPLWTYGQDTTVYHLDTTRSLIHWKCANHRGTVHFFDGTLSMSGNKIVDGRVRANMRTIHDEDIEYELMRKTLENILKSPEFFDVKHYPYSFLNVDITEKISDSTHRVWADLTVLGGDVCAKFTVTVSKADTAGVHLKTSVFTVDRTKWGIRLYSPSYQDNENNPQGFEVPDEVELWAELYFIILKC